MPFIKGKYVQPVCYCGDNGEITDYDGNFVGYCTSCNIGKFKQFRANLEAKQDRTDKPRDKPDTGPLLSTQVAGEHYKNLKPQPIEIIEQWGLGFHLGAALKYIARAGKKPGNSAKQDIEKAIWFLRRYCEVSDGVGRVYGVEPAISAKTS